MISKTSSSLPPFPTDIATAPIASVSLPKLLANDPSEGQKVLEACTTHGFFYLDLRDSSGLGQALIDESESLLHLAKEAFDHPLEEKQKFNLVKGESLWGYKEAGAVKQTDSNKRRDTTEFFCIAKDHLHGVVPSRNYPPEIDAAKPLLQDFTKNAHACGMLVLATLARQLDLPPTEFTERSIFTSPSGDHCRLTCKLPHGSDANAVGLPSHTDFGSVTILFNWLGGLQIQSHDPAKLGEWEYVKPLPGHAIINLGDAMVKFTNGALKSAKHRVVPAPGAQANVERYSVVYFVRPANDVMMEPVPKFQTNGHVRVAGKFEDADKVLLAGEWMRRRALQMGS